MTSASGDRSIKSTAYPLNEVSFYSIDPDDPSASWRDVQSALSGSGRELSHWAVRFLRSGLDGAVKSVAYEPHYVCKDHTNLYSHFYSKKFATQSSHVARLHFFSRRKLDKEVLIRSPADYASDYIGFSVVRPVAQRNVGRTIVDPAKLRRGSSANFYVLKTNFNARIFGAPLAVAGFPYMSQDSDATLCGHSALWGICRYFSQRYPQYGELLPYDLILMTHTRHGRVVPHRGMSFEDYSAILTEFGTHPVIIQAKGGTEGAGLLEASFRDICTYVESGVPILASFSGHAVTVIGHTLDWSNPLNVESGWLVDHSCFFDALIINDDNHFPYSKLTHNPHGPEQNSAQTEPGKRRLFIEDLAGAVCPLPEKVFLTASRARNMCLRALELRKAEVQRLGDAPFVTRLFFTNSSAFKKRKLDSLVGNQQLDGVLLFVAQLHLPHFVWVMEVGPVGSHQNGKCCGEFVLDATAGSLDPALIYSRVGRDLEYANRTMSFASSPQEYAQFTHNLGEKSAP